MFHPVGGGGGGRRPARHGRRGERHAEPHPPHARRRRHSGGGALLDDRFHVVAGSNVQGGGGEVSTHEFLSVTIDSDCDGLSDEAERNLHGSDPLRPDTDDDGLPDALEVELGTDPSNPDSDEDGVPDFRESSAVDANGNDVAADADPCEPSIDNDEIGRAHV